MPEIEGNVTVRRASHVLPFDPVKRTAFVLLRAAFGDQGRISDWTRTWKGYHIVEIVDGPILGPYRSREDALQREVEWLEHNRF
jgi:hypothetical protein